MAPFPPPVPNDFPGFLSLSGMANAALPVNFGTVRITAIVLPGVRAGDQAARENRVCKANSRCLLRVPIRQLLVTQMLLQGTHIAPKCAIPSSPYHKPGRARQGSETYAGGTMFPSFFVPDKSPPNRCANKADPGLPHSSVQIRAPKAFGNVLRSPVPAGFFRKIPDRLQRFSE